MKFLTKVSLFFIYIFFYIYLHKVSSEISIRMYESLRVQLLVECSFNLKEDGWALGPIIQSRGSDRANVPGKRWYL